MKEPVGSPPGESTGEFRVSVDDDPLTSGASGGPPIDDDEEKELANEAKRLRALWLSAEVDLFIHIFFVETEKMHVLYRVGCSNIASWIDEHRLTQAGRYESFRDGYIILGQNKELAHKMGVDAVVAARMLRPHRVQAYVESILGHIEKHRGVAPRLQWSEKIRQDVDPRQKDPPTRKYYNELQILRGEVRRLKQENLALQDALKESERANARLRVQLDKWDKFSDEQQ